MILLAIYAYVALSCASACVVWAACAACGNAEREAR